MSWSYDPDGSSMQPAPESTSYIYNNFQSPVVTNDETNNNESVRAVVLTQTQRQEAVFDYHTTVNQTNDFENGDLFQPEEIFQLDQPLKPTNHAYNYNAINNNNNVPSSTILNLDYNSPNLHHHLKYDQTASVLEDTYFPFIDERSHIQHQYPHFHAAGDSYPCAQDSNGGSYYCNKSYFNSKKEPQEQVTSKNNIDKPLSIQIPNSNKSEMKPLKRINASKFLPQPSNYVKDIDTCLFTSKSDFHSSQISLSHLQEFRENLSAPGNFETAHPKDINTTHGGGSSFNQLYCGNNGHNFNSSTSNNNAMYLNTNGLTSYNSPENVNSSFQY